MSYHAKNKCHHNHASQFYLTGKVYNVIKATDKPKPSAVAKLYPKL